MSRESATCVIFTCDDCGEQSIDDYTAHYPAGETPDDWQVIDGKDVCDRCAARRVCATEGHDWCQWLRSFFYPSKEYRLCLRCDVAEEMRDA